MGSAGDAIGVDAGFCHQLVGPAGVRILDTANDANMGALLFPANVDNTAAPRPPSCQWSSAVIMGVERFIE
jgi:hypothetical protein